MWFLKNLRLAFRSWHLTHVTLSEWHPESTKVLLSEPSHHEKLQTGRMECHHLHIMWVLDVGFQSDTSTNDGKKVMERVMEGDCVVEKTYWGVWRLGWWTQMDVSENSGTPKSSILTGFSIMTIHFGVPLFLETPKWFQDILYPDWNTSNLTNLSTKVRHLWWKTVGSSFHRGAFSCVFFLRWQLSFLRMLGVVEKMDKHPAISKKKRFNEVKWDNVPPKPTVLQQRLKVSSNSQMQKNWVCPTSGWQFSDFLLCQSFCLPMESMGLVYLPKNYHN